MEQLPTSPILDAPEIQDIIGSEGNSTQVTESNPNLDSTIPDQLTTEEEIAQLENQYSKDSVVVLSESSQLKEIEEIKPDGDVEDSPRPIQDSVSVPVDFQTSQVNLEDNFECPEPVQKDNTESFVCVPENVIQVQELESNLDFSLRESRSNIGSMTASRVDQLKTMVEISTERKVNLV